MLKFGLLLISLALCQGHAVGPAVHAVHAPVVAAIPLHHGILGNGLGGHGVAGAGLGGYGLGGHGIAGAGGLAGAGLGGHGIVSGGLAGAGLAGAGLAGAGLGSHGLATTGFAGHGLAGAGFAGHGIAGHGLLGHGVGNGHHLYKRSPHVVAPYEHVAPIAHVAPVAVSHQHRVDVRTSPAVVAVVPVVKPVLTSFVPAAPLTHTFAGNFGAGHYGGQGFGSAHAALGHY
ncbi:hypothetical protein RR46_09337 [Papilio xuthus]|uniref:Cuticular protein n=1 Tax=Papilio xuthus TaxID=66420 RepID=A0A194Q1Z7_PAPXU|nr:hypothetical protein RR46_09337 [Papilio xuthus]